MSETKPVRESYSEGTPLTHVFGNHAKVKIIAALLSEKDHDINVTDIARLAGVARSTVHRHLGDLVELGIVERTRESAGNPMYQINRDSEIAEQIAKLEWDLIDVVAETQNQD